MSRRLLRVRAALASATLALLVGCATPRPTLPAPDASDPQWQGRLAIQVAETPPSRLSASFTLQGAPRAGQLELVSPLGSILARIVWGPEGASLQTSGAPRTFASLDALTLELVGAELPLAHLFDWLQGRPTPAEGWAVDLSDQAQGRIRAQRLVPPPAVDLRLVLER